jgi:hypothetical protein
MKAVGGDVESTVGGPRSARYFVVGLGEYGPMGTPNGRLQESQKYQSSWLFELVGGTGRVVVLSQYGQGVLDDISPRYHSDRARGIRRIP